MYGLRRYEYKLKASSQNKVAWGSSDKATASASIVLGELDSIFRCSIRNASSTSNSEQVRSRAFPLDLVSQGRGDTYLAQREDFLMRNYTNRSELITNMFLQRQ